MFDAFVKCEAYANAFDASVLKDGEDAWNYQSYFFNAVGKVSGTADAGRAEVYCLREMWTRVGCSAAGGGRVSDVYYSGFDVCEADGAEVPASGDDRGRLYC